MRIKKLILSLLVSGSLLFGYIHAIFAESVAVKGDLIFIADRGLRAKNLLDGQPNQCVTDQLLSLEGTPVPALLQTASNV